MSPPPASAAATSTPTEPDDQAGGQILIVEADDSFRERLRNAVRSAGMDAVAVASGSAALKFARARSPRVAVVGMTPASSGAELRTSGLRVVSALRREVSSTLDVLLIGEACVVAGLLHLRCGLVPVLPRADLDQLVADIRDPQAALARYFQQVGQHFESAQARHPA